jgi:hypothetical protein
MSGRLGSKKEPAPGRHHDLADLSYQTRVSTSDTAPTVPQQPCIPVPLKAPFAGLSQPV